MEVAPDLGSDKPPSVVDVASQCELPARWLRYGRRMRGGGFELYPDAAVPLRQVRLPDRATSRRSGDPRP
jgi:hypothetical protein